MARDRFDLGQYLSAIFWLSYPIEGRASTLTKNTFVFLLRHIFLKDYHQHGLALLVKEAPQMRARRGPAGALHEPICQRPVGRPMYTPYLPDRLQGRVNVFFIIVEARPLVGQLNQKIV